MTLPDTIYVSGTKYASPRPRLRDGLYHVLHDKELFDRGIVDPRNNKGVWWWRKGLPEVQNFDGSHVTKMLEWVQRLAFDLNPGIDPAKFRVLYNQTRAFTNGMGFDTSHASTDPGYVPRRDYINRRDLDAEFPRFDKSRVCGGATIAGCVNGNWLEVETLNVNMPVPLSYVQARPWLTFTATTVSSTSTNDREIIGDFPQRGGLPCIIPLVTTYPVRYPMKWLEAVDNIADPYMVRLGV